MKLTPKQIKATWIVAVTLVIIHFTPTLVTTVRQQITDIHPAQVKPSPAHPVMPPPVAPSAPVPSSAPTAAMMQQAGYIGVWRGSELMPNRDMCHMQLELRWSDKKQGEFVGYLTRQCAQILTPHSNDISEVIRSSSPVSGILSGPMVNDAIQLHLDNAIGEAANGCRLTDYTVRRFGEQIAAIWNAGTCPAGEMMLSKVQG